MKKFSLSEGNFFDHVWLLRSSSFYFYVTFCVICFLTIFTNNCMFGTIFDRLKHILAYGISYMQS